MESGIYLIKSTINGKEYVGSAVNLKKRQYEHLRTLKKCEHKNILLQNHFNKYGDALEFSTLEYCEKEDLIKREQHYIDKIKPIFNICKIASSALGVKRSDAIIAKMRITSTGKKCSEETKQKMREATLGKRHSNETKKLIAKIRTGTKRSNKTKKKLRDAWVIRKERGPMFSEESRKRISEAHSGENHPLALFTNYQVSEIKQLFNDGWTHIELAKILDVSYSVMRHIKTEKSWANIEPRIILNIN